STLVIGFSIYTGYRASVAARGPQYLLTKTQVVVEATPAPSNEVEAEVQRRFAEAGEDTAGPLLRPMVVVGLLDGALAIVAVSGFAALLWSRHRRRRRGLLTDTFEHIDKH